MRRLYLQFYLTIVASLILVVVTAGALWRFSAGWSPVKQAFDVAWTSSPIADVAHWRSPVLLIQGDDDRNVPFSESVQMAEALRKQGVYFEQLIFPDEIHDFLMHTHWLAAYEAAEKFLDKYLKP